MKTGVKGKGCACAAPSQTRAFSLRKNVPEESISKALGWFHLGKIPFGSRGQSRGCSPGVHCSPPLLPRGSPRRCVLPRWRGPGEPAAPSRCLRLQRQAELCQHRREGAEVPDTPWGLREQTASPPAWRTGPLSWQRKHQTWAGGSRGREACRRLAVAVLAAKLTSSYPRPQSSPSSPTRPRSSSSFRGSLFAEIFSPFPMLAR